MTDIVLTPRPEQTNDKPSPALDAGPKPEAVASDAWWSMFKNLKPPSANRHDRPLRLGSRIKCGMTGLVNLTLLTNLPQHPRHPKLRQFEAFRDFLRPLDEFLGDLRRADVACIFAK